MIDITKHIGRDKLAHFFASYVVLVVLSVFFSVWVGYVVIALLTLYKDVVNDLILKKGKFEWLDMVFSVLPIFFDIIIRI